MTAIETVPAGKLICFSEGEYSDYGYVGHFLTLIPVGAELFETAKARIKARIVEAGSWQEYEWDTDPTPVDQMDPTDWSRAFRNEILSELIRMGALMDIDCTEIHIGSYGYFEL